jgi:hypothetical protein
LTVPRNQHVTCLTLQKLFTAESAGHAETSFCLLCVLSALGGEKLSQWDLHKRGYQP